MSFTLSPGQGTIHPHDRRGNDKAPHGKGTAVAPDGTQLDISIWKRVSRDGKPYWSVALEAKDKRSGAPRSGGYATTKPKPEFDDPLDL